MPYNAIVDSAAYGITPAAANCGPLIASLPKYSEVWFAPGVYTFQTYPTAVDFSNVFYRSHGAIWKCVTPYADLDSTPVFNWVYTNPQDFGVYPHNGSANDMTFAGVSPIEGIGIIGSGSGNWGTGLALGQSGVVGYSYFMNPRNFSVGGFNIGVGFNAPLRNAFQNGIQNAVLKNNNTGIVIDNRGSTNSGEQFRIINCHIGGNAVDGIATYGVQKLTVIGTSLDYNRRQMFVSSTATVELIGCYFEQNANSTPAETIAIDSSSVLMIQGGTIYGLPFAAGDIVKFTGTSSIVYFNNVGIYDSNSRSYINTSTNSNLFGTVIGVNGHNTAPALYPQIGNITFVADGGYGSGTSTVVLTKPAGTVSGNSLWAAVTVYGGTNGNTIVTAPAGWVTVVGSPILAGNSHKAQLYVFNKIAGGSEPINYTFTADAGVISPYMDGNIRAYAGTNSANPVNSWSTSNNGAATAPTSASVTTPVLGEQFGVGEVLARP